MVYDRRPLRLIIIFFLAKNFQDMRKATIRSITSGGLIIPIAELLGYKMVVEQITEIHRSTRLNMEPLITM